MTAGIVGLGLIGGSLAKAYHEAGEAVLAFATGKHPSHTVRLVPQQSSTTVSLFI